MAVRLLNRFKISSEKIGNYNSFQLKELCSVIVIRGRTLSTGTFCPRKLSSGTTNVLIKESKENQRLQKKDLESKLSNGPGFEYFLKKSEIDMGIVDSSHYLKKTFFSGNGRKVFFEVYGCQMNVSDTEIIWSILKDNDFSKTDTLDDADVVLIVTCAIREGAEDKIWNKLNFLKGFQKTRLKKKGKHAIKIGVLGCMAERLKDKLLEKEKCVDLVAGPDSYKDLPRLLAITESNQKAINVLLSIDETYADIMPVRLTQNSVSAFVSIMRGCDNMCTYCIVPFTRGRERSRPLRSILDEVKQLSEDGVKEVTLLGQNVNSYRDISEAQNQSLGEITHLAKGFKTVYKHKKGGLRFEELLYKVSEINPEMRIRFTSPHPKDFPDEVLYVIKERPNICKSLHLPAQSGSTDVLERMGRGYTREAYLELVKHVRDIIPNVTLSSDFICGFCGETDEEFSQTIDLMNKVRYNTAYMFPYSMREKTRAYHRLKDDISLETKLKRLKEIVTCYRMIAEDINKEKIGVVELVLTEGESKRSKTELSGRNDGNTKIIFPLEEIPVHKNSCQLKTVEKGDYVAVLIESANSQVLKGKALYHTTLQEFSSLCSKGYFDQKNIPAHNVVNMVNLS